MVNTSYFRYPVYKTIFESYNLTSMVLFRLTFARRKIPNYSQIIPKKFRDNSKINSGRIPKLFRIIHPTAVLQTKPAITATARYFLKRLFSSCDLTNISQARISSSGEISPKPLKRVISGFLPKVLIAASRSVSS